MIDIPQGIPSQIIDLAEKNVEQARRAFLGFIGAAQKATDAAQTLPSSAKDAMAQGHVICRKQRQRNLRPGAEARPRQGRERVPRAAVRIREAQMAAMQTQATELGAVAQDAIASATRK